MDWGVLWAWRGALWQGLLLTIELSAGGIAGSFLVGCLLGAAGAAPSFLLRRLSGAAIEVLRDLPVLVKLFFFYFAVNLDAVPAALVSLILHQAAYIGDTVASGLRAVPREQLEAARASGLGQVQVFRHVLLPQAVRTVLLPLTTQFIEVVKNSSVVMFIGIEELTFQTQAIEQATFRGYEAATAVTAIYLLVALAIARAMTLLQRRLRAP